MKTWQETELTKKAYNTLTKTTKRNTMLIVDQNDRRINDNESLLKTWTEYCDKLYNYPIAPNDSLINPSINENNEEYLPILESEVDNAIKTLKDDKSYGNDNIPSELLKHGGKNGLINGSNI